MMNFDKAKEFIRTMSTWLMMLTLLVLTFSILILAVALAGFTDELATTRKSVPGILNRIDLQIYAVGRIVNSAEVAGKDFSSNMGKDISNSVSGGINQGLASGIVDLPVNTVKDVGGKLGHTAVNTGKGTISLWGGIKDRLFFWSKKKPVVTLEATPEK